MSILKVANVHFDSAGTNRIDYLSDNKVRITSANGTILAGASIDALVRITQTGSGHALIVEDSANPDSTPFAIDTTGNVLIGRTDSTVGLGVKLDVNGAVNASAIYVNGGAVTGGGGTISLEAETVDETRYIMFANSTSGNLSTARVSTSLSFNPATGTLSSTIFNSTSDINKKKNLRHIVDSMQLIDNLKGYRFDWKHNDLPSLGVVAQEVEAVLPELIAEDKSVNYNGLIAVLIEAVKDLKREVEELKRNV